MAVESRVPQTKIDGGDNENKCFLPRTEPLLPLHPLFLSPPHSKPSCSKEDVDSVWAKVCSHGQSPTRGHHQMVNTEIRVIISFAAKDGEALYSQQKHWGHWGVTPHTKVLGLGVSQSPLVPRGTTGQRYLCNFRGQGLKLLWRHRLWVPKLASHSVCNKQRCQESAGGG